MKKVFKTIGIFLLIAFIIIQFIRPEKNISTAQSAMAKDISKVYNVPADVHTILQTSCYDCHSNNTKYPWYANVQPVAWWLNDHIKEGKKELNFTEFAGYRIRRKYRKLEEIIELVDENEMPLSSYTFIHRDANLSKDQKKSITTWATGLRDTIKATNPVDSLLPPKKA